MQVAMDRLLMEEFVAGNQFPHQHNNNNNNNNSDDNSSGRNRDSNKDRRRKQWRSIAERVMGSEEEEEDDDDGSNSSGFDCNICLDSVQDPVVTLCGHLYCWPCIYQWLNYRGGGDEEEEEEYDKPSHRHCPVCKSEVSQSALVPLFGRGQTGDDVSSRQASRTAGGGGSKSAVGAVIPRRPLPQRAGSTRDPSPPPPRLRRRGDYTRERPAPMLGGGAAGLNLDLSGRVPIPVVGMLGEIVFSGWFGYQNAAAATTPYQVAGGSPRVRRQMMQADKSLSRVCFFLFCCVFMCILLF